jgi:type II secretion system protein H
MSALNRNSLNCYIVKSPQNFRAFSDSTIQRFNDSTRKAFTLIELILVLALLVIITSIAVPTMSRFIRGRALGSESTRMLALMHAAQSRAVSEGMPMMFWINAQTGEYGVEAETSGKNGDAHAEELTLDGTLKIAVTSAGVGTTATTFKNLPAIKFLPDGTVDEGSPQSVQLTDGDGFSSWLNELKSRTGYEIDDHAN